MNRRKQVLVVIIFGVGGLAGAGILFYQQREPALPGQWLEFAKTRSRQAYVRKESEWSKLGFTAIEENQAFRDAIDDIPVRLETSLDTSQLRGLRELLYENLICRSTGDMRRYLARCAHGRPAVTNDAFHGKWVPKVHDYVFGSQLSKDDSLDDVFERFWRNDYSGQNSGKRFQALAKSGLIVIGDVRVRATPSAPEAPPPAYLFQPEELRQWVEWPGASAHRSIELHPGKQSLADVSKNVDSCRFADVALVIRSQNNDIWCWSTRWYLEPTQNLWEVYQSFAICSRRLYEVPL